MSNPVRVYEVLNDFDYKGFDFHKGDLIHSFRDWGTHYVWIFRHHRDDMQIRTIRNVSAWFIGMQIQNGNLKLIGKTSQ